MADTYWSIALITQDQDLQQRVTASAAVEGALDPYIWAAEHVWDYASQPTWGEKYQYAIDNGNPTPGQDPAVITDADILSAVQSIMRR